MCDVQKLIAEYVEQGKQHGVATLNGDYKIANSSYEIMIEKVKGIQALDSNCEDFLMLLSHKNESVKLWAATHALFMNETKAMETIQELAKGSGIFSFSASMVADEWSKDSLQSPF